VLLFVLEVVGASILVSLFASGIRLIPRYPKRKYFFIQQTGKYRASQHRPHLAAPAQDRSVVASPLRDHTRGPVDVRPFHQTGWPEQSDLNP